MKTMRIADLLQEMPTGDAIVSLLEVRVPIVVDDLDFFEGTWKGMPIHPKEVGQMEDIINSLNDEQTMVVKYSALLVNWGRKHEIARLLQLTPLGNLSSADAVLEVGETAVDGGNDSNNN